jgi:MFS family permease
MKDKNDPEIQKAKKALTAVNFFVETNRLEPYTAVYLIHFRHWNEVHFGIVSLCMNLAMLVFQTPAGDLLDKTRHKKRITAAALVIAAITTVMVVWTSNFWVILVAKVVEGISATIFLPALMSLLLGICLTRKEVPSFIARTEVSNKIGSLFFVIACALISYFAYPDVGAIFYLLGAGGLAAAYFTTRIPSEAIDHDRARQLASSPPPEEAEPAPSGDEESVQPARYRTLFKNKAIVLFAVLTFCYHLANAGVVPLLAQYVALISDKEASFTWTSAILIVFFFSQAVTARLMSTAITKFSHKALTTIAFIVLPIRCTLIALMILYWNNPYILVATQIFDGIGAGIYDIMLPIIVKKLTEGSGRFGFTYGFIVTCWRIGHGVSLLLGEIIVFYISYAAAFWIFGGIGLVNLISFVLFFRFRENTN